MPQLLLALICVVAPTVASGVDYYVAPQRSDYNHGTLATPFRTISKAAGLARAGDTVLLRGGVYNEYVVLGHSAAKGRPIVLRGQPGEEAVIEPDEFAKQPPGHGLLLQAREGNRKPIGWITIVGLEIRHGWDGIKMYNAYDVEIRNGHIHGNWNQGIFGKDYRVTIDRNRIAGNGTNSEAGKNLLHGIYATGSRFTVTNNVICSNLAYGIQVAAHD